MYPAVIVIKWPLPTVLFVTNYPLEREIARLARDLVANGIQVITPQSTCGGPYVNGPVDSFNVREAVGIADFLLVLQHGHLTPNWSHFKNQFVKEYEEKKGKGRTIWLIPGRGFGATTGDRTFLLENMVGAELDRLLTILKGEPVSGARRATLEQPIKIPTAIAKGMTGDREVEVFFSYSHQDETLRNDLEKHLSALKRSKSVRAWNDRKITPGLEWKHEISGALESADLILLLISADFLASDYCYDKEMQRAMERHEAGEARVVPVILRPCDWTSTPFAKLQALPKDAKAVTSWKVRDRALSDVATGIRKTVEEIANKELTNKRGQE